MLTFTYVATDSASGKKVKSTIQADSEASAAKAIKQQGLSPIEISLESDVTQGFRKIFNRVRTKDRVLFAQIGRAHV